MNLEEVGKWALALVAILLIGIIIKLIYEAMNGQTDTFCKLSGGLFGC